MPRLHLVRHGETEGQSSVRYWGATDVPLSAVGRAQIERLRPLLATAAVSRVVHSPLVRAAEGARILAASLATAPTMVAERDFREIDFGDCEGLTREEIAERHPQWFACWQRGEVDGFPGGEPFAAFAARVAAAAERVLAGCDRGELLVVAHRGVIRRIAEHLLRDPEGGERFGTSLGSLSTIRLQPAPCVEAWDRVV